MTGGIAIDGSDDNIRVLVNFDQPVFCQQLFSPAEDRIGSAGQHMRNTVARRRNHLNRELVSDHPADFVDQLPQGAVVVGTKLAVPLSVGTLDGIDIRQARIKDAVCAAVSHEWIVRDAADCHDHVSVGDLLG